MKNLVEQIETFFRVSTPASRKKLGILAERVILVILVVMGCSTVLWAIVDKPCNNGCGEKVDSPSSTHLVQCSNCGVNVWNCPNLDHPHKVECPTCRNKYWDCPGDSEALLHGIFCQFSGETPQQTPQVHPSDEKQLDR